MSNRDRDMDDKSLIIACKNGDQHASAELIERFEGPVFNAAYRILGQLNDAEDVSQTVFMKVFENLDNFDPKYRLFSWVYRIAINESLNYASKQRSHADFSENQHASHSNVEQARDTAILGHQLGVALMQLSEDYRTVVVLKHVAGCSYEEISEILEVAEKTVRSRLYSARQKLQVLLLEPAQELLN